MSERTTKSPVAERPAQPGQAGGRIQAIQHKIALPVVLAGLFMTILDFSIVNVAIPSIQRSLHASAAEIQLVVAGYGLTYGALLVTGGRLGDRFGRRRIFMIGVLLFTVTSVACGVAPSAIALVISRLAQGAAAAILFPQVLSIINVTYKDAERARAFATYALVLGTAWVGGQVLGGVLINADLWGEGWRICFLINVPVGVLALMGSRFAITESRSETAKHLDLLGVVLATVGLALLVYPLVEGRQAGWPVWSFVLLAVSVPVLLIFMRYQYWMSARGRTPLVEPVLLRSRGFVFGVLTVFATYAGMASFFLVFAVYLQEGERYSPLDSGLTFLPLGIGFFVVSLLGRRMSALFGNYSISLGGLALAVGEAILAVVVRAEGPSVTAWELLGPLALTGIGMGLVLTPLIARALAGVDPDHAGSASGVLSTMQQIGNSVGVALIGVVFYTLLSAHGRPGTAYANAFAASMIYAVVLALGVGAMALFLPRQKEG